MLNHTKYSDLTPEQYELLGRAFIEWSNIEFLFGVLLSRLLFTPEFLGRTYSDDMSAARLESAIKNALEIHRSRYQGSVISKALDERVVQLMAKAARCRERALARMKVKLDELSRPGVLAEGSSVKCPCVWKAEGTDVRPVAIPRYNNENRWYIEKYQSIVSLFD